MGTILGTAGHSTLGNNENAMPRISINAIANTLDLRGSANTVNTSVSITVPIIIIVAPLPILSYMPPNNGVSTIDVNGSMAGIEPAIEGSTPYFDIMSFVAKSKKG